MAVEVGAEVQAENRGQGSMFLRYEDVAQHGGLKVHCMPHGMGVVAFGKLWNQTPLARASRADGILPILSRVRVESLDGPVAVFHALDVQAWYQIARTVDAAGQQQRVLLNLGADLFAPRARTHDPQPAEAGQRLHVGRVFAEHVFTRPFAKTPAERRVSALRLDGQPVDVGAVLPWQEAARTLDPPPAARPITETFEPDAAPVTFGLAHTDSNQHVNSLAYIPLFENAVLRQLHRLRRDTAKLHLKTVELAYRKPCFAGETMEIQSRLFERDGGVTAQAYLGEANGAADRAHCMASLEFVSV